MSNRNYNVFFNTHTVSGIVISVALYIIFFAGAFSLFKEEIGVWQEGTAESHTERKNIDYDNIFKALEKNYALTGRDLQLNLNKKSDKIHILLSKSKDALASDKANKKEYFSVDIKSADTKGYVESYSLGEFIYRLHFFAQFPYIGIYLAGFVSLFFLFAIATGVIVHWKKIIANFYTFNPKNALKRVWTDAHTALGVIGLPFQFMFAVTGAYFCLSILVLVPANFLYGGDQSQLMADLRPERKTYEWVAKSEKKMPSFNAFAQTTANRWEDFHLTTGFVRNYGGTNMKYVITGELKDNKSFTGTGRIVYNAYSGDIEEERDPHNLVYSEDIQRVISRLHFGDFGGLPMKFIYFILSLITCFVIVTGVLIYVEARNKKSNTLKQRLYTTKVGHIYMAICLSMFPVTALAFLFVKITNTYFVNKQTAIYSFFFVLWLLAILYFRFKRDNYYTNKVTLLSGAILGLLIPITSGIVSNNWIWTTYKNNQFEILSVDILWILLSITAFLVYLKIKPSIKDKSASSKNPIDYKNIKALKAEDDKKLQPTQDQIKTLSPKQKDKNHIEIRTKIIILWLFLGLGWIVHHIYGLFNIYYKETLIIENATGAVPVAHHIYRILFEGLCLLFALLTIEISKNWFKWTAFVWAIIAGLYNVYHFVEAILFERSNISEIFTLLLVSVASVFLVKNLHLWIKE
ncbi:PepSY-associated TM helix domain-containing protein [Olleya sp. HaHaR_3_96]|uniref:PepSY-associated TM helix domain-containing protein n=1 Tax=Olleya sp. HaHaR_3_96 TaxID=2745560 RepID=UPI001C4EC5E6|nr:PepSY-associated TM helix domain-containing protein [Olleya sp. HaHaR_3_96]QXP60427.1 PepSY domain-containing protein [Olleya sp. HaHaR_3_96]